MSPRSPHAAFPHQQPAVVGVGGDQLPDTHRLQFGQLRRQTGLEHVGVSREETCRIMFAT